MNATAVVTFPNSDQAFDALKALEASSGSMVYGSVVATKDQNGSLFLNETTKDKVGGTIASAFIGGLAGLFFGWLGALIVYMMKKDESAFLRDQSKESLNFQLTMIVGWVVAFLCSCCIGCGGGLAAGSNDLVHLLVNLASGLPFMALGAMNLIFTIMAALAAKKGDWYKYPFAIRLIK